MITSMQENFSRTRENSPMFSNKLERRDTRPPPCKIMEYWAEPAQPSRPSDPVTCMWWTTCLSHCLATTPSCPPIHYCADEREAARLQPACTDAQLHTLAGRHRRNADSLISMGVHLAPDNAGEEQREDKNWREERIPPSKILCRSCRTKESKEKRVCKHEGNSWKGGKAEEAKGTVWETERAPIKPL